MRKPKNDSKANPFKIMRENNALIKLMGIGERNRKIIEEMDFSLFNREILDKYKVGEAPSLSKVKELINMDENKFGAFMVKEALYGLPNKELLEFIESELGDKSQALEIGGGNGWFSKLLGIRSVDNYMQKKMIDVREYYINSGQYPIDYINSHVEEMEALEGIERYKPKVVFGSYITDRSKNSMFCIEDWKMFDMGVEKYILLCSEGTHDDKRVLKRSDVNIKRIDGITTARNIHGSYLLVITKK